MSYDQGIALIASLGACFSAFATFLTVRQIAKQREASYRPELALSRTFVKCSKSPVGSSSIPELWVSSNEEKAVESQSYSFYIPLHNIGLGSAKSVVVSWSFPFETIVKDVNELAQRTLSAAYFSFQNGLLSIESVALGNGASMWVNQREERYDFILPVSVQNQAVMLELPHAYIQIVSALLHLAAKDKDVESFPEIPALRADFEFLDIGEKKRTSSFEIIFRASIIHGNGEEFHGYLESKKNT